MKELLIAINNLPLFSQSANSNEENDFLKQIETSKINKSGASDIQKTRIQKYFTDLAPHLDTLYKELSVICDNEHGILVKAGETNSVTLDAVMIVDLFYELLPKEIDQLMYLHERLRPLIALVQSQNDYLSQTALRLMYLDQAIYRGLSKLDPNLFPNQNEADQEPAIIQAAVNIILNTPNTTQKSLSKDEIKAQALDLLKDKEQELASIVVSESKNVPVPSTTDTIQYTMMKKTEEEIQASRLQIAIDMIAEKTNYAIKIAKTRHTYQSISNDSHNREKIIPLIEARQVNLQQIFNDDIKEDARKAKVTTLKNEFIKYKRSLTQTIITDLSTKYSTLVSQIELDINNVNNHRDIILTIDKSLKDITNPSVLKHYRSLIILLDKYNKTNDGIALLQGKDSSSSEKIESITTLFNDNRKIFHKNIDNAGKKFIRSILRVITHKKNQDTQYYTTAQNDTKIFTHNVAMTLFPSSHQKSSHLISKPLEILKSLSPNKTKK